jgi:2-iminobutanoate/2-iminopropanoate deaminase
MKKDAIYTGAAPKPGAYSQAIRWGDLVFVAGQTSEDPETGAPVRDSVAGQTERILRNIGAILEAAGSSLDLVLRADVYLSSLAHKPELDRVFRRVFASQPPARNTVAVAALDDGLDVEIEVIAGCPSVPA